jgi:uncharacterized damage-inducible protein DinB
MTDLPPPALPANGADLRTRIDTSRAALERDVAALTEQRLAVVGADGWSVKDHLAHIAAWERVLIALLRGAPEHEAFGIDAARLAALNTDGVNAILHERSVAWSPAAALTEFQAAHTALLSLLDELPEAGLFAPLADDDLRPRMQKIAGDTYLHYDEHRTWITPLLESKS